MKTMVPWVNTSAAAFLETTLALPDAPQSLPARAATEMLLG